MPFLNQFGIELQEEGDDKQPDVHAIDIGISSYNNLVIAQIVQSVFYIQGGLQQVKLFVFVNNLLAQAKTVQRFTAQREHGLRVDIAAFRNRSAGRIALSNEDTCLFLAVVLRIAVMNTTVSQLPVMQTGLLCTLTSQLRYAGHSLAFVLTLSYFIL